MSVMVLLEEQTDINVYWIQVKMIMMLWKMVAKIAGMDAIRNKENATGVALMAFAVEWDG